MQIYVDLCYRGPHVQGGADKEIHEGELRELHDYILPTNISIKYDQLVAAYTDGESVRAIE